MSDLKTRVQNAIAVLTGKKLSRKVVREIHLNGEFQGAWYSYECWGQNIVRRSPLRDSRGGRPSTFYDFEGNLFFDKPSYNDDNPQS